MFVKAKGAAVASGHGFKQADSMLQARIVVTNVCGLLASHVAIEVDVQIAFRVGDAELRTPQLILLQVSL